MAFNWAEALLFVLFTLLGTGCVFAVSALAQHVAERSLIGGFTIVASLIILPLSIYVGFVTAS